MKAKYLKNLKAKYLRPAGVRPDSVSGPGPVRPF